VPSAITSDTKYKFHPSRRGVPGKNVINNLSILASDTSKSNEDFTVLSVNTQTGGVKGLQRLAHGGIIRQISTSDIGVSQGDRRLSSSLHSKTIPQKSDRKFTCGVDHTDEEQDHDRHRELHNNNDNNRHHHHHEHRRTLSIFDTNEAPTSTPSNSQQGEEGFVLNILIAVDKHFILKNSNSTTSSTEYINLLISAVNTILGSEMNVRLNIVRVDEIDIMKDVDNLRDGLKELRLHYEGTVGIGKEEEGGETIHLVHALLGQDIGGGIAFIDTVCSSQWSVGLSSGLQGSMDNLADAFFDVHMIAHEIGHSLGSGHTFEYDPPIDTCNGEVCPVGLPLDQAATLMSYCNFCDGNLDNIAMSYGGVYSKEGPKADISSWSQSPQLTTSSVSTDAQRVNHHIWKSLLAKGECIRPTSGISDYKYLSTPQETVSTTSPTQQPTQDVLSVSPSKSPSFYPDTPQDDERIYARPGVHCKQDGTCATAPGVLFDIEHLAGTSFYGINIETLQFSGLGNMTYAYDLYSIQESMEETEHSPELWDKVASIAVNETSSFTEIVLDKPITIYPGRKQGIYLSNSEGKNSILVGLQSLEAPMTTVSSTDYKGVALSGAYVVYQLHDHVVPIPGYTPVIKVGYSLVRYDFKPEIQRPERVDIDIFK